MGRLIDADALVGLIKANTMSNGTLINTNAMVAIVEKMPTAYDVDKVVAELKQIEICPKCLNNINPVSVCATFCDVGKRLEIVKRGGVE